MADIDIDPDLDLSEDELTTIIKQKIEESKGDYNSRLSEERKECLNFYNRTLPEPPRGRASLVQPIVYNSVRFAHAAILKLFSNGTDIVRFSPIGAGDVSECAIATAYTSYVVFKANEGFNIMSDAIHDGLMARMGVVKADWVEEYEDTDEEFEGLEPDDMLAIVTDPETRDIEISEDEDDDGNKIGTISGTLRRRKDKSGVKIYNIAPEDFLVDPQAVSLKTGFHAQRVLMTRAEIKAAGFDTKKLKDASPDADDRAITDSETYARNSRTETGYSPNQGVMREQDMKFWLYEAYIHLASDTKSGVYRVVMVCDIILDFMEVKRSPFHCFVPIRQSHMLEGENFAHLAVQSQAAQTMLTRAFLDSTAQSVNQRWGVVAGGLVSPRELLENRMGGIVNVKDPESVFPLPQGQINPISFQVLQMLKDTNEETTSISALAQGINPDAVSSQNSQGMISDLVTLSQTRLEVMARYFGEFLKTLFIDVYSLIIENDKGLKQDEIEVAGDFEKIDPTKWIARKDADVTLYLTRDEALAEAARLASILTMGAQDPVINSMITPANRYAIAQRIIELNGWKDSATYITPLTKLPPPEPPSPPPPDPAVMAGLQVQQMQAETARMVAQAEIAKGIAELKLKERAQALQEKQFELQSTIKMTDQKRKDLATINDIDIDQREMQIAENSPQDNIMVQPKPF